LLRRGERPTAEPGIGGEHRASPAVDEDRPCEAFLDQHGIAAERIEDLLEAVGEPRGRRDPIHLMTQVFGGGTTSPETLERGGLHEVAPNAILDHRARHRLIERPRRPDLVRVVDAEDRLLRASSILERQLASVCERRGEQSERRKDTSGKKRSHGAISTVVSV